MERRANFWAPGVPLDHFEMSRLGESEFRELARLVRHVHGLAYDWDPVPHLGDAELDTFVHKQFKRSSPDQVRQAIEAVVELLDDRIDDVA